MADGFLELTKDSLSTPQGITELNRMLKTLFDAVVGDGKSVRTFYGYGSPENVITANIGSIYLRKDGGAVTTLYVKTSGIGSAGWTAK